MARMPCRAYGEVLITSLAKPQREGDEVQYIDMRLGIRVLGEGFPFPGGHYLSS